MTDHEKAYFGTILGTYKDVNTFETSGIIPEMLTEDGRKIYAAISKALDSGVVPDISVIYDLDKSISIDLLSDISERGDKLTVSHTVKQIKTKFYHALMRRIGLLASNVNDDNYDDVFERCDKFFNRIDESSAESDLVEAKVYYPEYINHLEEKYKAGGLIDGIKSGYAILDGLIYGLKNGTVTVIGARPSQGKSAALLNMAWKCAQAGKSVGFISIESGKNEIFDRLLAHDGGISSYKINTAKLAEVDYIKCVEVGERIHKSKFYIFDKPNATIDEIKSASRMMKRKYKIDVEFIDYLQNISVPGEKDRIAATAKIAVDIKQLARMLDIPVVIAAQVNRDAENNRPHMGNLGNSSEIERAADVIIMIWNRKQGDIDTGEDDYYWLVEKNRNGATGWIRMNFIKQYLTFNEHMSQTMPALEKKRGGYGGR